MKAGDRVAAAGGRKGVVVAVPGDRGVSPDVTDRIFVDWDFQGYSWVHESELKISVLAGVQDIVVFDVQPDFDSVWLAQAAYRIETDGTRSPEPAVELRSDRRKALQEALDEWAFTMGVKYDTSDNY